MVKMSAKDYSDTYTSYNSDIVTSVGSKSGHSLEELPKSIKFCSNIRDLYFRGNHLTSLPDEIGNLTKLKVLMCDNSYLESLPDGMNTMESLTYFDCRANQLTSIADFTSDCTLKCDYNYFLKQRYDKCLFVDDSNSVTITEESNVSNIKDMVKSSCGQIVRQTIPETTWEKLLVTSDNENVIDNEGNIKNDGIANVTVTLEGNPEENKDGQVSFKVIVDKTKATYKFKTSKISPLKLGKSVKLIADNCSEGNCKYKFNVLKDGKTVFNTSYRDKNSVLWTPKESGTYTLVCRVQDSNGNIVRKSMVYEVK